MTSNLDSQSIEPKSKPEENLVRSLEDKKDMSSKKTLFSVLGIIMAGILSGFIIHNYLFKQEVSTSTKVTEKEVSSGESSGSTDTKTFKDSAEGQLESGGIDGEGTHRLIRPGGDNQTVYLTSSVLDLNKFTGKKVRVWGQTFSAKKAGWLMDIGKVDVL